MSISDHALIIGDHFDTFTFSLVTLWLSFETIFLFKAKVLVFFSFSERSERGSDTGQRGGATSQTSRRHSARDCAPSCSAQRRSLPAWKSVTHRRSCVMRSRPHHRRPSRGRRRSSHHHCHRKFDQQVRAAQLHTLINWVPRTAGGYTVREDKMIWRHYGQPVKRTTSTVTEPEPDYGSGVRLPRPQTQTTRGKDAECHRQQLELQLTSAAVLNHATGVQDPSGTALAAGHEFVTNWGRFLYTRDISGTISPSFRVAMQHSCTRGQNRDTRGQNRDEL
eukprot:COSAG02_NODE_6793_length_3358_cov_16.504449_3_plen_278_part_00